MSSTATGNHRGNLVARWFADRRVITKIGVAVGVALLFMGIQGVHDLYRFSTLSNATEHLNRDVAALGTLGDARAAVNRVRQRALLHVLADSETKPGREREIKELDALFDSSVAQMRQSKVIPDADVDTWLVSVTAFRTWRDEKLLPASRDGVQGAALKALLTEGDALFKPVEGGGVELGKQSVAIAVNEAQLAQAEAATARTVMLALLLIGLAIASLLATLVARGIVRSLAEVRRVLDAMAEGDLTQTANVHSADETGQMASALNRATTSVRSTVQALATNAQSLAGASEELSANSAQIASAAQETSTEAAVASTAVQQISDNVRTVAAGAEQMTASIREIAENASEAARVAAQAVGAAGTANTQVSKLGESSLEIGNVIKVITSIAEQTNLLALNATIEAARAGAAGKGFAVVADEVKQLAQETARATGDISRRVEAIQSDTTGAISAIGEIAQIIEKINDYQTTIASAVEEQTATTNEMSHSVAAAADSSEQVNVNIAGVASAAQMTTGGVDDAQRAASELAQMSTQLQGLVDQFRY